MIRKNSRYFLLLAWIFHGPAVAGLVEGPLVVWFNMSTNLDAVDARIEKYLSSGEANRLCWNTGAVMYMHSKPAEINRALIKSAIYEKNGAAIGKLNNILRKPFDGAKEGFDGIIVYSDAIGVKYYSLTTGRKKIRTLNIDLKDLETGMCVVLPEIVRKP